MFTVLQSIFVYMYVVMILYAIDDSLNQQSVHFHGVSQYCAQQFVQQMFMQGLCYIFIHQS